MDSIEITQIKELMKIGNAIADSIMSEYSELEQDNQRHKAMAADQSNRLAELTKSLNEISKQLKE